MQIFNIDQSENKKITICGDWSFFSCPPLKCAFIFIILTECQQCDLNLSKKNHLINYLIPNKTQNYSRSRPITVSSSRSRSINRLNNEYVMNMVSCCIPKHRNSDLREYTHNNYVCIPVNLSPKHYIIVFK